MKQADSDKRPGGLDPWHALRVHTDARIGLGRVGDGLPTKQLLEFQMAHARARDSVHMAFNTAPLRTAFTDAAHGVIEVYSAAPNRPIYLQRPDYGRRLQRASREKLLAKQDAYDVAFIIADGLSARATQDHGADTCLRILDRLAADWSVAPIILAHQARVGLGDEIGAALGARLTVMLIGERPGLSSADSLGAYLTWGPKPGRSNADRNCVSNIRPAGLSPDRAADKIAYLMTESRKRGLSGVALKDNATTIPLIKG